MNLKSEKHLFTLLWDDSRRPIESLKNNNQLIIEQPDLVHRIQAILRLTINDAFILFDQQHHALVVITAITKKQITTIIQEVNPNKILKPEILCVLPLLKREALETAIDALTQLGATTVQLVTTQKIHRSGFTQKDFDRLQRIIGVAAEQSKNFSFPTLLQLKKLEDFLQSGIQKDSFSIFFDPQGKPAFEIVSTVKKNNLQKLILMIGPEGDLNQQEKVLLKKYDFTFMALTPTILRAEQAISLGLGLFRTLA